MTMFFLAFIITPNAAESKQPMVTARHLMFICATRQIRMREQLQLRASPIGVSPGMAMDRGLSPGQIVARSFQQLAVLRTISVSFSLARRLRVPSYSVGDGQQRLLGHLLRASRRVRIEHHEVTRRCHQALICSLQHADEVAADGLIASKIAFWMCASLYWRGDQPI